jgi:hypothetical protein
VRAKALPAPKGGSPENDEAFPAVGPALTAMKKTPARFILALDGKNVLKNQATTDLCEKRGERHRDEP